MNPSTALTAHRLLMRLALSAGNAFAWLFIFEYNCITSANFGDALARTVLLYALAQAITALVEPYALRHLRQSLKRVLVYGTLAAAASFVFLGAVFDGYLGGVVPFALVDFAILSGAYRALYKVPYIAERQATARSSWSLRGEILVALMPALAGLSLGFRVAIEPWILFASGALIALSLLPLAGLPDVYEHFPWNYRETFVQLFSRNHRRLLASAVMDGIQGTALLLLWPITIFLLVGWSYAIFGVVFTLSLLVVLVVRESIMRSRYAPRFRFSTPVRVAIAMSAWIGRFLVVTPLSMIFVDAYFHIGSSHHASVDHPAFEQLSDGGLYVDEYTALREIGLAAGRIAACCLAALVAFAVSLPIAIAATFMFASFAAGVSIVVSSRGKATA